MGQRFNEIKEKHIEFIGEQKMFFVATAGKEGKVNLSPKGSDSFYVLNKNRVVWLNLTGSGNETSSHVQENGRMTIMFCAFEGSPLILRLYGIAKTIHPKDKEWEEIKSLFPEMAGTRQFFDMQVDLVLTSCGTGVPLYKYSDDRNILVRLWKKRGQKKVEQYWKDKNGVSIDGIPIKM